MANVKNFSRVTVSGLYSASDTSVTLLSGHGADLPAAPFHATWWNYGDYGDDPTGDPNVEIVNVTAVVGDVLTIVRPAGGNNFHDEGAENVASIKNISGKIYKIAAAHTAAMFNKTAKRDETNTFEAAATFQSFVELEEISTPSNPAANKIRVYSKDDAGTSRLYYRRSDGTELEIGIVPAVLWGEIFGVLAEQTDLASALAGKQPLDSDLTAIAALSPANDDVLQRKSSVWTNRTPAQFKTDLALVKADVGLGSADNTPDADKPVSTAQQTALNLKADLTGPSFTDYIEFSEISAPSSPAANKLRLYSKDSSGTTKFYYKTSDGNEVELGPSDGGGGSVNWGSILGTLSSQTDLQAALDGKQPIDADLTAISGLSPTNDDIIQRKAGAWINRTPAQLKTDLVLVKADVGLGNADDTSDVNKPISTATQTALDLKSPINNPTFTGTVGGITKAMVGLGNADDTTDLNKPVSIVTQAALDLKAFSNNPAFTGIMTGTSFDLSGHCAVGNASDLNETYWGENVGSIIFDCEEDVTGSATGLSKTAGGFFGVRVNFSDDGNSAQDIQGCNGTARIHEDSITNWPGYVQGVYGFSLNEGSGNIGVLRGLQGAAINETTSDIGNLDGAGLSCYNRGGGTSANQTLIFGVLRVEDGSVTTTSVGYHMGLVVDGASSVITEARGFSNTVTVSNSAAVTTYKFARAPRPTVSGSGAIGTYYGYYADDFASVTGVTTDWQLYFVGANSKSKIEGTLEVSTALLTPNYVEFTEVSAPSSPATNKLRLYAKDVSGITKMCIKDSSGTETDLGGGGGAGITNSASAGVFPMSDGTNLVEGNISYASDVLTFDALTVQFKEVNTEFLFGLGSSNIFGYTNNVGPHYVDGLTGAKLTFNMQSLISNRTVTFPDASGTLSLLGVAQTWSAVQTHSSAIVTSSYMEYGEIATPSNPSANGLRLYAKDVAGVTKLHSLDSSGTETVFGTGGTGVALGDSPDWTGDHIWTKNGAASTPTMLASGTWFTGGSTTTTKPLFLIEPSGTTSTGWSTLGTGFGLNAASGFTGYMMELQRATVVKFSVDAGTSGINNPRVGIGARPPAEATLFLNTDNTSGTNLDVRSNLSNASSTVECQAHDYDTNFQSVFLQYVGSGVAGNTFTSIANADLAQLIAQDATNFLIGTATSAPLIFGTNFVERMRISSAGAITVTGTLAVTTSIATDNFYEATEISTPSNPAANKLRLYAKDVAGVTKLHSLDSSGTETVFGTGGSGVALGDSPTWTGTHIWTLASGTNATFERTTTGTTGTAVPLAVKLTTSGSMADTFGVGINFILRDTDAVDNIVGRIYCQRIAGDDGSGQVIISTGLAGTLSARIAINSDSFWPATNNAIDVGTVGTRFRTAYFATSIVNAGYTEWEEMAAPSASASGKARLYMDSTSHTVKVSENGGGYRHLFEEVLERAVSDESTALTTGTAKITFRMPYAFKVTAVRSSINTVSSSGLVTVDINEGGTTILSTKLSIDASEKTSTTAATAAVISDADLADDAEMTIDIDAAGTGAKGLKVLIYGYRV